MQVPLRGTSGRSSRRPDRVLVGVRDKPAVAAAGAPKGNLPRCVRGIWALMKAAGAVVPGSGDGGLALRSFCSRLGSAIAFGSEGAGEARSAQKPQAQTSVSAGADHPVASGIDTPVRVGIREPTRERFREPSAARDRLEPSLVSRGASRLGAMVTALPPDGAADLGAAHVDRP